MYLLKNGSVYETILTQVQPRVNNPLDVPLQLKKVYEQEADVDFGDLYGVFKLKDKMSFTADRKQEKISIIDSN